MRAEVVAVGTELLLGENVDTNSAWLSARLAEIGVDVHRHTTVGDNHARMVEVIGGACARADVVVVSGGLGPTRDDLTRYAVAELAGVALERHDELVAHMRARFARAGREMPDNNLVQADIPARARIVWPVGTAAGFAVDAGGAQVWCLPGVPWELQQMVEAEVLPALREAAGTLTTVSRLVHTAGMGESHVAAAVDDVIAELDVTEEGEAPASERDGGAGGAGRPPTIALLASGGETRVRVTAQAPTREEALARLQPVVDAVVERLGAGVAGIDDEGPEHHLARLLGERGSTLAVAESVTGGRVAERLVAIPGASGWFRGGLLVYATELKAELAGVDAALLEARGPIDEDVAGGLARGAARACGASVGLAVVGVAGPDPQGGAEVGTTIAAVWDGEAHVRRRVLPTTERVEVQRMAASMAIDLARRVLARGG
jgi:nicotinamide-nucleotide amidase